MKNDGGPAFPQRDENTYTHEFQGEKGACVVPYSPRGMSLRDYFAASVVGNYTHDRDGSLRHVQHVAMSAYAIADAMLAEREKER